MNGFNYDDQFNQYAAQMPSAPQSTSLGSHTEVTVLMIDKESNMNMRLIKFFRQTLQSINAKGIRVTWVLVREDEIDTYRQRGTSSFPLLIHGQTRIEGVTKIIEHLRNMLVGVSPMPIVTNKRVSDNDVHDYLMAELHKGDSGQDLNSDRLSDSMLSQQMNHMNKMREQYGLHTAGAGQSAGNNGNSGSLFTGQGQQQFGGNQFGGNQFTGGNQFGGNQFTAGNQFGGNQFDGNQFTGGSQFAGGNQFGRADNLPPAVVNNPTVANIAAVMAGQDGDIDPEYQNYLDSREATPMF